MEYHIPEELKPVMAQVRGEYAATGAQFLKRESLLAFREKTGAFSRHFPQVLAAAESLPDQAAIYALFLSRAMVDRATFLRLLPQIGIPDGEYPLLGLLAFLPQMGELYDWLRAKGLPEDVVRATVGQFEDCLDLYEERFGRLGMNKRYFDHMQRYVDHKILNVGRLRFEPRHLTNACVLEHRQSGERVVFLAKGRCNGVGLHADTPPVSPESPVHNAFFRETEEFFEGTPVNADGRCSATPLRLSKRDWFLRVPLGAACLAVHIPPTGILSREACAESYRRAVEIFGRLAPQEKIMAFTCESWMMAPELGDLLKPDSRLLEFQKPYLRHPIPTQGKDVFNFVFKTRSSDCDLSALPEDTSLQRALKRRYLAGGFLYEYGGILPL